ncbi:MAG: hypothetical protein JWM80_6191 [Cyanobacteria bacterium RYN_339]|nr:hypothetical protein [Cyanobacteria bacterium RYN_339]
MAKHLPPTWPGRSGDTAVALFPLDDRAAIRTFLAEAAERCRHLGYQPPIVEKRLVDRQSVRVLLTAVPDLQHQAYMQRSPRPGRLTRRGIEAAQYARQRQRS